MDVMLFTLSSELRFTDEMDLCSLIPEEGNNRSAADLRRSGS